jgi:hypothetical protein
MTVRRKKPRHREKEGNESQERKEEIRESGGKGDNESEERKNEIRQSRQTEKGMEEGPKEYKENRNKNTGKRKEKVRRKKETMG